MYLTVPDPGQAVLLKEHWGYVYYRVFETPWRWIDTGSQYLIIVTTVRIAFSTFETELASLLDDIAAQETSLLKATDLAEAGCESLIY